jgi:hypothetical protein
VKRQVAITGATPEFVRWSIRFDCSLRADTDIASTEETEKRLRAIREAGAAINAGYVHDGIAVRHGDNGQWMGFRIDDVFGLWGGCDRVQSMCASCDANLSRSSAANTVADFQSPVAGCFGWLTTGGDQAEWHRAVEEFWPENSEAFSIRTSPHWYSIWADRTLKGNRLDLAAILFRSVADHGPEVIKQSASDFHRVLEKCRTLGLIIDVELVPAGFSDGISWTIGRHCDRCKAPFEGSWKSCRACKKQGSGHPEIKKRVLGLRPWVALTRVIGEANVKGFLTRAGLNKSV